MLYNIVFSFISLFFIRKIFSNQNFHWFLLFNFDFYFIIKIKKKIIILNRCETFINSLFDNPDKKLFIVSKIYI